MIAKAKDELARVWNETETVSAADTLLSTDLPEAVIEAIKRSINSPVKSYRYVLPTQLVAKRIDPSLDCRALQEGSPLEGAFDARSIAHAVVVPFDRDNHSVLGGSPEPYVNNPLRIASILPEHRSAQKNKQGFDDLCLVLEYAQKHPAKLEPLLLATAACIRDRLSSVHIMYPVPNRISLKQAVQLIGSFIESRTGGVRLQAVSKALFNCIGHHFNAFARVESHRVNAADASTGKAADLNCFDEDESVVFAVEVKDRKLALRHVQDKLPAVRESGIRELLFLVQGGVDAPDTEAVDDLVNREFAAGQNIYICDFQSFLSVCLVLFAETGRRTFLTYVGQALDEIGADLPHRQEWRDRLGGV